MKSNSYVYAYWTSLGCILYALLSVATEGEFLPNPLWLITGKPAPGFCSTCGSDLGLIMGALVLVPVVIWLRSKTKNDRVLISKKNLAICVGLATVFVLIGGAFWLHAARQNEDAARKEIETNLQRKNDFKTALRNENSPLLSYFIEVTVVNHRAAIYLTSGAARYFVNSEENNAWRGSLKKLVMETPGVTDIVWVVGERIFDSRY